jgi:hypothetical protein
MTNGTAGQDSQRQGPVTGGRNLRQWWLATAAAVIAAGLLAYYVADRTTFDSAQRALAALAALLVIVALWLLAQAILLTFQSGLAASPDASSPSQVGMQPAFVGQDNRASTSKTQVTLWTTALVWALVDLLLLARSYRNGGLFTDALTTNWHPDYLVLLGLPVAAATVAKVAVTSSNNNRGPFTTAQKEIEAEKNPTQPVYVRNPKTTQDRGGLRGFVDRIAELLTGDDGSLDWADLQYATFTLITLIYFVLQLLSQPTAGLPAIPPALLTLMGVSTTAYAANKVASTKGQAPPPAPPS